MTLAQATMLALQASILLTVLGLGLATRRSTTCST